VDRAKNNSYGAQFLAGLRKNHLQSMSWERLCGRRAIKTGKIQKVA
jgi:hypothetical protein